MFAAVLYISGRKKKVSFVDGWCILKNNNDDEKKLFIPMGLLTPRSNICEDDSAASDRERNCHRDISIPTAAEEGVGRSAREGG